MEIVAPVLNGQRSNVGNFGNTAVGEFAFLIEI